MGRRDVACNVFLPIMVFLPLDHVICLSPDHVIVGMEYGDVARYVSTCLIHRIIIFMGRNSVSALQGILG